MSVVNPSKRAGARVYGHSSGRSFGHYGNSALRLSPLFNGVFGLKAKKLSRATSLSVGQLHRLDAACADECRIPSCDAFGCN
jgi:hypothetical protein